MEFIEHKKTHGKPFIYECKEPNCGKKYNHSGSFHSHKKRNHQPHQLKPQCECCNKSFSRKDHLKEHQKRCLGNS
ncbi:zinc finger protein, partial [Loa loa]